MWEISALNGCVKLKEVEIGRVPKGFVGTTNQLPLHMGRIYRATVRASSGPAASKPWLVCPQAPAVIREDDYWLVDPPRRCSR